MAHTSSCVSVWISGIHVFSLDAGSIETVREERFATSWRPHPKFAFKVKGIQQFDNVMVVAWGQDVDLNHVIL